MFFHFSHNFFKVLLVISIFMPVLIFAKMESANFTIDSDVFNSGGNEGSSSANFSLQDSIGEAVILSATSTSANYGAKAGFREMYPDIYLTLSIPTASISLGNLSPSQAKTASHTMTVITNNPSGFTATVSGATLSAPGIGSIGAAGAVAVASSPGTEQFGINLVANNSPSIGADPAGSAPIGSAANQYDQTNLFAYSSGAAVADSANAINETTYTVSYIANISSATDAGSYSTSLTYSATINP